MIQMIQRIIKLNVLAAIFLFSIAAYLYAGSAGVPHEPGDRYSSSEARQHYMQGKDFYSLGRYEEARNEFGKALSSIDPPRLVTESQQAQSKKLEIVIPERTTSPKLKAIEKENKEKAKQDKAKGINPALTAKVSGSVEGPQQIREYYIDIGDILDISVWQIPDLSKPEVIVRPDGKISFPLIGDIKAEGLSFTQLDNIITEKLKTYVKVPEVSIMIRRFGEMSNKVSILGEVPAPGVYRFSGSPSITEVIASAGGYTKHAVLNSVMIIRGDMTDVRKKPDVFRINLVDILKGNKLTNNLRLKSNDIVYVPRSFIGNLTTFMELIQPGVSEYMQFLDARRFQNIMHRKSSN